MVDREQSVATSDWRTILGRVLRTAGASNPITGVLAQGWSEFSAARFEARVHAWIKGAEQEMSRLGVRLDAVTDAQAELMERIVEKVHRQSTPTKVLAYSRLFARSVETARTDAQAAIDAIEALDSLTIQDLDVLRQLKSKRPIRVEDLVRTYDNDPHVDRERKLGSIVQSLSKLESRGLVGETTSEEGTGVMSYWGAADHWANRWKAKYFEVLPFGRRFLELVEEKSA